MLAVKLRAVQTTTHTPRLCVLALKLRAVQETTLTLRLCVLAVTGDFKKSKSVQGPGSPARMALAPVKVL